MHLLVVGGGSAGHVLPAVPVMQHFLAQGAKVSFVGTRTGLEQRLVADLAVDFHAITAGKLRRYFSLENLIDLFRVIGGVLQALLLLGRLRPDVVFSKGGFVSFPVVFAAWVWRVPVVAHESDLSPGLANRLVRPFVNTFCVSFIDTRISGNVRQVHSGTPLRAEIMQGDAQRGRAALGVSADQPLLVVTGGSLGADHLNTVVREALPGLLATYQVVHVVGAGKQLHLNQPGYIELEYVDRGWGDILAAADIVISRAGANALFELIALRKLCLLVPLSDAVSRGDQLENAAYAEAQGLAMVAEQEQLTPASLCQALADLEAQRVAVQGRLARFPLPPAAEVISAEIETLASGRPTSS